MKKTRICACFLAIAMTFSLACPVFAAGENVGSPALGSELTDETVTTEIQLVEAPVIEDVYLLSPEDLVGEDVYLEGEYDDLYLEGWYYGDWWDDWTPPEPTLIVNGSRVEADLVTENGASYTTADTLNAILGTTHLTGDKVAIRDAAEAAGWDVVWNADNNQIVLLDRENLLKGLATYEADGSVRWTELPFTQLDALMGRILDQTVSLLTGEEAIHITEECEIAFTAFNSLDGDETYHATLKSELIMENGVYDLTLSMAAADLLGLFSDEVVAQLLEELPQLTLADIQTLLKGIEVELLMDMNAGTIYASAPFLSIFDKELDADTWYFFDLGAGGMDVLLGGVAEYYEFEFDTAALLYESLLTDSEYSYWGAEDAYSEYRDSRLNAYNLLGDHTFARKGDTLTWTLEESAVNQMLTSDLLSDSDAGYDCFREFEVSLSVSDDLAEVTGDVVLRLDTDALAAIISENSWGGVAETASTSWLMGLLDFRLESHSETAVGKGESTYSLHWKNAFLLEMTEVTRSAYTADSPRALPPEGALIIEP